MNDLFLARLPTPEDDNKPVIMNPGSVETARDRESARPLATSAISIDAQREGPPVTTMSSETPMSAPLATASTEQTDFNLTEMHSSTALRVGDHNGNNQHISQPSPVSSSRPHLSAYELEATVVSKTVANENYTAYQPGGASRQSLGRSPYFRDFRDSALKRSTTAPRSLRSGTATPTTAFYHPNISDANRGRSANEASGSDPFLGTGRPMRPFPSSPVPVTSVKTIETPSPSIERLRSSRLDGTPGVLDLHDSQEEILSLLNKLQSAHITHTNNEVDSALMRCQDDLRLRSKDKAIGTAEANILDREAARIGRGGGTPTRPAQDTEDAALLWKLRREMTRLVEDARAALDAAAEAKSQASSTPRETKGYIPYRVGEDSRVAELRSEIQDLRIQVDQLHAEKEQACKERQEARKENSDLLGKVDRLEDEVKGYRREYPRVWGKDWKVGSRRSE